MAFNLWAILVLCFAKPSLQFFFPSSQPTSQPSQEVLGLGEIETFAGNGKCDAASQIDPDAVNPARSVQLCTPSSLAFDAKHGALYVATVSDLW